MIGRRGEEREAMRVLTDINARIYAWIDKILLIHHGIRTALMTFSYVIYLGYFPVYMQS